ncbi:unnamed protein product [Moneuplotes crassus]|uniref:RRM domain-containing protein n=1 Tax=Euplotes crassus TaxID=5936 RepID=A0AAD1XEI4_EUPCR|nr:unnamed protein product [Moneuplotes crassus]
MDTQEEQKENSSKLKMRSKEFKPSNPKPIPSQTPTVETQAPVDGGMDQVPAALTPIQDNYQANPLIDPSQYNDANQLYLQYVNYYLNCGLSSADAEAWAKYYIDVQSCEQHPEQNQAYFGDQYKENSSYQEEYHQEEYHQDDHAEGIKQEYENYYETDKFGDKTKKPKGERRKEKYRGQHHEKYHEAEEGYYDELGFYYNPDGSFYDPDGYYFDPDGYDKYGGYYDDNANYIKAGGRDPYSRDFRGRKYRYYEGDEYEEEEEEVEDKYTDEYIQYITNSKYYEDLEYLKNTNNKWAYLKVGNLAEGTVKTDLLKYFGNQNIETSQITIMMTGGNKNPVGGLEIYRIPVAIQVLKECGNTLNGKRLIIEVDSVNEKLYNGTDTKLNEYEYEDETDARYTKFDPQPEEPKEEEVEEGEFK